MTGDLIPDAVVVEYAGPATLGSVGRCRFHDREGSLGDMLWEALDRAGWVGEMVTRHTLVRVDVGVVVAPAAGPVLDSERAGHAPLSGGLRRVVEGGWIDGQGIARHRYVGPLNGRAAGPGYRLLESDREAEQGEFGEDLLHTAAARAGWLSGEPREVVEIPDVRVAITVARRRE